MKPLQVLPLQVTVDCNYGSLHIPQISRTAASAQDRDYYNTKEIPLFIGWVLLPCREYSLSLNLSNRKFGFEET